MSARSVVLWSERSVRSPVSLAFQLPSLTRIGFGSLIHRIESRWKAQMAPKLAEPGCAPVFGSIGIPSSIKSIANKSLTPDHMISLSPFFGLDLEQKHLRR